MGKAEPEVSLDLLEEGENQPAFTCRQVTKPANPFADSSKLKSFEERVWFSALLMGSRQRAKGDVPEPFQPPTLLRAACQDLCLAPSWGTWRFLGLCPNHGETNIDMSQCPREGVCCLCIALLAPTQMLAGS